MHLPSFRSSFQLIPVSIERLRRITPKAIASGEIVLWVGPDAVLGALDVEINGRHAFEIPQEGFLELQKKSYLGEAARSRFALNSACLVDWCAGLLSAADALKQGDSHQRFDLAEHGFEFSFVREEEAVSVTVSTGDELLGHYLNPWLANRITNERVPLDEIIREAVANGATLLEEVVAINEPVSRHSEMEEIRRLVFRLGSTAGRSDPTS